MLTGMARQSWRLYRANLSSLFLAFVPFFFLTAAVFFAVLTTITLRADNILLVVLARDLIRIFLTTFGVAVAVIVLADRLAGRPGSVRASLRETRGFAPSIALAALIGMLPYVVTFFLFGPYMAPFLRELFVGPPIVITAIVLERRRVGAALGRARELLDMQWSRVLLYLITFAAGVGLFDFVIQQSALRLVTAASTDLLGYSLAILVSIAVPAILMPYVACVWLIAYFDLRARAEDFDETAMIALRTSDEAP